MPDPTRPALPALPAPALPQPSARLRVVAPGAAIDGEALTVRPGDLIGRAPTARLLLPPWPGLSEAHALISLRGAGLVILPLRGALSAHDPLAGDAGPPSPVPEAGLPLERGLELTLGPSLRLIVEDRVLPAEVLAIEGLGEGRPQLLPAAACALLAGPPLRLVGEQPPEALLYLWQTATGALVQRPGPGAPLELAAGQALPAPLEALRLVRRTLPAAATPLTHAERPPLVVRLGLDRATLQLGGPRGPSVELRLKNFELLLALVDVAELPFDSPARHHRALAEAVWGPTYSRHAWKTLAGRVRDALAEAGLPPSLIASDGHGCWSLDLGPDDQLIDETAASGAPRAGRP